MTLGKPVNAMSEKTETQHSLQSGEADARLYVPDAEGWQARLKQGWQKEYCYAQYPGDDHFHMLLNGEIYLQRVNEHEKYCLTCALRLGIVTPDRLYWQRGGKQPGRGPL